MRKLRNSNWWGLYALIPLAVGLIVLDAVEPLSETWHLILLAAIVVAICRLALTWVERNARLVETDGFDRLRTYRIWLDTADGASAEQVVRVTCQAQGRTPAPGRDAAVPSAVRQTAAEDGKAVS